MRFAKIAPTLFGAIAAVAFIASGNQASAKPAFAMKEGKKCNFCHLDTGKNPRGFRGMYYAAHNFSLEGFDEIAEAKLAGVKPEAVGNDAKATVAAYPKVVVPAALAFTVKDIDGKDVNLARYAGDVILVVNVASKCGNTPQYASMEKLYEKYKEKGLTILGFPANEFGMQEPGTNAEIKEFCSATYQVKFPMFAKSVVKGDGISPLYKFLTDKEKNPKTGGPIEWNFAKFLINRKGEVIARFGARVDPATGPVLKAIEDALAQQ